MVQTTVKLKLQIQEKYREGFIKDITSVQQQNRYEIPKILPSFKRVAGRGME